ncbi:MAG: hypothetical protein QHH15_05070 [Candidatus Thermoplasmatota archaeon]|jgi:hypothetical protein|nr:hypothetical protein [Candidatus Thermoplasmatota archaeon]
MKGKLSFHNNCAVSEVLGSVLLIAIAIVSFVVLRYYLFPDLPPIEENIKLIGYVNENGIVVIEHTGGKSFSDYKIVVRNINGTLISSNTYRNVTPAWKIGDCKYPLENIKLNNENDKVQISIFLIKNDRSEQIIFDGILSGKTQKYTADTPMLVSSLKTDTPDEDLICYTDNIIPDINKTTYIYNWLVNGNPIAELVMPFDTNSSNLTKDYSGNNLHAFVRDCLWVKNGVIGGCYYFSGSKEYISLEENYPPSFDDIQHNDFTISIWVKTNYLENDNKIILEIRKDTKNFIRLYQKDNKIYFGVCTNDVKRSVVTPNIQSNIWYHIVGVWKADHNDLAIYLNGMRYTERGDTTFSCGAQTGLFLGHGTAGSGGYWWGYMDELEVYNYVLSDEQINQIYLNQKDGDSSERVLVSQETSLGQSWQVIVTPNDSIIDGTPVYSNILTIVNYHGGK